MAPRKPKERVISPLNEEQLQAVLTTDGPLRVAACAGSGKTTMLVERFGFLVEEKRVDPERILLVTFSSDAKTDMERRLKRRLPAVDLDRSVRTAHSIALEIFRAEHYGETWTIDPGGAIYRQIVTQVLGDNRVYPIFNEFLEFVDVVKQEVLGYHEYARALGAVDKKMMDAALRVPLDPEQTLKLFYEIEQHRHDGVEVADHDFKVHPISYDDMLYDAAMALRVENTRHRWASRFDYVMQDETQDESAVQRSVIEALASESGNYCVVGDPAQCHPPGVLIEVDNGETPIEFLATAQEVSGYQIRVRGWNRNAQRMLGGRKATIARRAYSGRLYDVTVHGRTVPMTPNHKVLARWTDRTVSTCVTYLMWRADYGYRVGWCKLFAKSEDALGFHLAQRARLEKAEKVWILRLSEDRTEASVYESIIATSYGLPTITFEPVNGATHLTRAALDAVLRHPTVAGPNEERGRRCLVDHQLDHDLPLWPFPPTELYASNTKYRRGTYFPVYAINALPGLMSLPLPDAPNTWRPIDSVSSRSYSGPVYSLDVETDHAYAANGVVVLNSIYGFRGSRPEGILAFGDRWENAQTIKLTGNYRAADVIVHAANASLASMPAETIVDLRMIAKRGVLGVITGSVFKDPVEEAQAIVRDMIATCQEEEWRDFAVLTRTNNALGIFRSVLEHQKIPFRIEGRESVPKGARNVVTLSTIHKAKGREWSCVYMPQLQSGTWRDYGLDEHEERRVFYVALTRARDRVHLSYSAATESNPNNKPCAFTKEIGVDMHGNLL